MIVMLEKAPASAAWLTPAAAPTRRRLGKDGAFARRRTPWRAPSFIVSTQTIRTPARKRRAPTVDHADPMAPCSGTSQRFRPRLIALAPHITIMEAAGRWIASRK